MSRPGAGGVSLLRREDAAALTLARAAAEDAGRAAGLREALASLERERVDDLAREAEVRAAALALAAELLGAAVDARLAATVSARDALRASRRARAVLLRAHPDEVEAVRAWVMDEAPALVGDARVEVAADAGVARGDVVAESDRGVVAAGVSARLAALRAEVARGR